MKVWELFCHLVATTFRSGMLLWLVGKKGKGGGTVGSVLTTGVMLTLFSSQPSWEAISIAAVLTLVVGIICVPTGERYMLARWGALKRHTGQTVSSDYNETNIDEVHGQLLAALPIYLAGVTDWNAFVAFHAVALLAFRFFDSVKVWPVRLVERHAHRLSHGAGVMLDDTAAGLMAMAVTALAVWAF